MENINYTLIHETAKDICEHYNVDIVNLEEWEICELVDRFIDEQLIKNKN
jgi:hypothetical protein